VWSERASNLWGHREEEENDREREMLDGEREPLEGDVKPTDREMDKSIGAAGLDPG
jgi:hypothetical protein